MSNYNGLCTVPISIGELWDKYTILCLKRKYINDEIKLFNITKEMALLKPMLDKYPLDSIMFEKLYNINNVLWKIEDNIRLKEDIKCFDDEFIELSRSVYKNNDIRAAIKKEINIMFHSVVCEEKSYQKYST